jgi:hypothetical protein
MAIPWATNLLHFHIDKLFKKGFVIWHYFVWQLFWLLFKKLGNFSKSSGHPAHNAMKRNAQAQNAPQDRATLTASTISLQDNEYNKTPRFERPHLSFKDHTGSVLIV